MDQAFIAYQKAKGSRRTTAVEGSLTKHQEDCARRLAIGLNTGKAANTPWRSKK